MEMGPIEGFIPHGLGVLGARVAWSDTLQGTTTGRRLVGFNGGGAALPAGGLGSGGAPGSLGVAASPEYVVPD